eukprot:CAMPEP_0206235928 /NCGR_PEP_ID=MMETSP0047_2-20121206/13430_1 /ASSEMBLY_ACC=CAM_ASM_000192 /TAXON_ID=195065 /ORGANISM="Chroomonas mesostigmatica_cf, Strain CCMP1168" /LENGTH=100 /DNA_ID=CAMNT_0053660203 /DNA_START=26 /DNA_END=324 /DNA_ORIENTATION=+
MAWGEASTSDPAVVYGAVPTNDIEAFGAIAPAHHKGSSAKRITAVVGATALAMAITALILLASQPSAPTKAVMAQYQMLEDPVPGETPAPGGKAPPPAPP